MITLERYLKNPYWEKVYKEAPSERAKKFAEYTLREPETSKEWEIYDKETTEDAKELWKSFTDADWDWMIKYFGNAQAKHYYRKQREALQQGKENEE